MKTAEEFLSDYLGGNMNVTTLTPLAIAEFAEAYTRYISRSIPEIDSAIQGITDLHPYKEMGNRDSYSQYNEGWSDACDVLGETIKKLLT